MLDSSRCFPSSHIRKEKCIGTDGIRRTTRVESHLLIIIICSRFFLLENRKIENQANTMVISMSVYSYPFKTDHSSMSFYGLINLTQYHKDCSMVRDAVEYKSIFGDNSSSEVEKLFLSRAKMNLFSEKIKDYQL